MLVSQGYDYLPCTGLKALTIGFALTLVWVSNAVPRPPAKRSAAMGIVNGFGNLGNLSVALNTLAFKLEFDIIHTVTGSDPTLGRPNGDPTTTNPCLSA